VVCDEKKPQKKKRTPITPTRQQKLRISGHVKEPYQRPKTQSEKRTNKKDKLPMPRKPSKCPM
jgi:hypothetical protein